VPALELSLDVRTIDRDRLSGGERDVLPAPARIQTQRGTKMGGRKSRSPIAESASAVDAAARRAGGRAERMVQVLRATGRLLLGLAVAILSV
jgi:hypothetical protein